MTEVQTGPEGISSATPLPALRTWMNTRYGDKAWTGWEPETILLDLKDSKEGKDFSLLKEKILVLQILEETRDMLGLPEFLIWAARIANNELAEFEYIHLPTSLELAWLITQVKEAYPDFTPTEQCVQTVAYLLNEEGYSFPIAPFDFVPKNMLHEGQMQSDTSNKKIAIDTYISHMRELKDI